MLKGIPDIISSDLMKCMMDMGHGDVLVLTDANFPAVSHAKHYIKAEGVEITDLLDAILTFLPVDDFVETSYCLMNYRDSETRPEIWDEFEKIIVKHNGEEELQRIGYIDRLDYYTVAEKAYVVVQTATLARYANITVQKGVI
ncbi:MAG TPA: fucose operon FucU protein [Candidatus Choladousia intestinavium]|uniref:Fucose operon FucU protein n=1 Tax=Candidatus Choladousia intestinavium TaxID=2840727 RepID=A0A9D1ADR7_9FIRM|nr:fucose operon FucU protein [Candidatus Choladousia intestinavium]